MRKLEKFIAANVSDKNTLDRESMMRVNGAIGGETTQKCFSFEHTCSGNCQDREWVRTVDGVEVSRTKAELTADC
jgi:hypothetical protein